MGAPLKHALSPSYYDSILNYQYHLTQPYPHYATQIDGTWKTVHRPLKHHVVRDHIEHRRIIGTLGRWYIEYGIIDIDDATIAEVEAVRASVGLTDANSVIFTSASAHSYHVYFRPVVGDQLPTISYYRQAMGYVERDLGVELYPHPHRVIRLPFGRGQGYLCRGVVRDIDYMDGMALLASLEEYDLRRYYHEPEDEGAPLRAELGIFGDKTTGWKTQGLEFFNDGLSDFGTRLEATKRVIYLHWANNIPLESTILALQRWLDAKHHGYSRDYADNRAKVHEQTAKLARWIYDHYERRYILPDVPLMIDRGYLTPESVRMTLEASRGSLPLLKFALPLVAYVSIRGGRKVSVHRDRLASMGSATNYQRWIGMLEDASILTRGTQYSVENYAKQISLTQTMPPSQVLASVDDSERPATTIHEWIPSVYTPEEFYRTQARHGVGRTTILMQISEIYQYTKKNTTEFSIKIAKKPSNQARITEYLEAHPTATQCEVAEALGIGRRTVERYVKTAKIVKK